jgi:L-aminopeptidase/D-esterase-like protein
MTDFRETAPSGRPRARGLGVSFEGETGPANAITDVAGVEVGYRTLILGEGVRTGVTVILPRGRAPKVQPTWAGMHSFNGNGEMTGSHWVAEAGHFTGPIAITNTNAIGAAHEGLLRWMLATYPHQSGDIRWFLPVAAETYDGYLSDIETFPVRPEHVGEAIAAASPGPISEGNVGGGTGMQCYGFKGGSGTASRRVAEGGEIVGAFVQANFGRRGELMMRGRPVGRLAEAVPPKPSDGMGSIIVVLATDAALHSRQLEGLARRATVGVARTGAAGGHGSGDIFLAFSTAPYPGEGAGVPDTRLTAFFEAAAAAVEEAILNALVAAESLTGYLGRRSEALDHDLVRRVFAAPS